AGVLVEHGTLTARRRPDAAAPLLLPPVRARPPDPGCPRSRPPTASTGPSTTPPWPRHPGQDVPALAGRRRRGAVRGTAEAPDGVVDAEVVDERGALGGARGVETDGDIVPC